MPDCPEKELLVGPARPFEDLRAWGLLWLINRVALHHRGFALALCYPEGASAEDIHAHKVQPIGFQLVGDGREPWQFADDVREDRSFRAVEALLARTARENKPAATKDSPDWWRKIGVVTSPGIEGWTAEFGEDVGRGATEQEALVDLQKKLRI